MNSYIKGQNHADIFREQASLNQAKLLVLLIHNEEHNLFTCYVQCRFKSVLVSALLLMGSLATVRGKRFELDER